MAATPQPSNPTQTKKRTSMTSVMLFAIGSRASGAGQPTACRDMFSEIIVRARSPFNRQYPALSQHLTTQVIPRTSSKAPHRNVLAVKAASSSLSGVSRDVSPAASISETATIRGKKARKAKLEDLPPVLRKLFTERFIPLTHQYLGTRPPWSEVTLSELQTLHRHAFGAFADEHPPSEGDKCFRLGRLQGPVIFGAFASHLEELRALPVSERTREHASDALAVAIVASLHALTHFQTCDWRPPKGLAGWFSYENYADTAVYVDGKTTMDKRLTRVIKVVNALSKEEWREIELATNELIDQRNAEEAKGGRRRRNGKKAASNVPAPAAGEETADRHASDGI
ncbi:hypothetical protein GSI_09322 [Ganoderma sinense ZZ0214-1]|uniref:Uncharacterized protein n=1 Tax=Ganoderma sinense ZZ0214-1 TaxID=1077348 RepID=A0A2G8S669_9APHY|nr:hypothetical protein GSI_09322 [Ganoderma sinense ZZ0214-1]